MPVGKQVRARSPSPVERTPHTLAPHTAMRVYAHLSRWDLCLVHRCRARAASESVRNDVHHRATEKVCPPPSLRCPRRHPHLPAMPSQSADCACVSAPAQVVRTRVALKRRRDLGEQVQAQFYHTEALIYRPCAGVPTPRALPLHTLPRPTTAPAPHVVDA